MPDMNSPVTNIILGTMTLGYRGFGARVHDLPTAGLMLDTYARSSHDQLDTSIAYGDGSCEEMLGDLHAPERFRIATRFDPITIPQGHEPENLKAAFRLSLERLKATRAEILYVNSRDTQTPIEETLSGVQELHELGLISELGLLNLSVAEVEEFVELADITQLSKNTYAECLRLWEEGLPFLSASDRDRILGGTAAEVLRWPET